LKQDHGENLDGDGMDLAVCTINKQNNVMQFAGANRSLYYLIDKKIELIKGNKYGVGGWPGEVLSNFETHSRSFDPNGIIYLTTDGFCDQLGGIFSRRISTKRMLNWLQAINTVETAQQEMIINQLFEEWRGENEQTDDVLMIGIRLNAITGNKK
jgi:serine phosphatase RsbU (regulator of sigma subunit)